jgi:class 3 adenylate cyclase/tetratricopeptide (TPR) repeat protein
LTCSKCGTINRAGRKFCANCGATLAVTCPACQATNEPGERFCGDCGIALPGAPEAVAAATIPASADPGVLAERRLVTVLFADLVGFTPYSEDRDAEDVRAMLSNYFELATDIVQRYGGTVEKFIGDAVMAVWGTPVAHEDDAERAVRAALDLIRDVPTVGEGIQARAGVLTGEVAVTIGALNEGMVAGDIVNTAARLQAAAAPGTVLVGEATYRAVDAAIAFEPAGDQTLKGKASPVPAWVALRVVGGQGGRGRSDLPEPPFVGRDEEVRLLRDTLDAVGRDRRPRLVSITGPGGIGKSRLAWEFEKYVDGLPEAVYWHRGRCPAYGAGITFWALGEMIRRRAGLVESADDTTTRDAIRRIVAEYVDDPDDRRWVEPALLTLLGIEDAPPGGRDVLFAAWRIFFERIASRGTTVLLFEDLQWADSGLLDFIDHLLEWARSVPIVVVTLARPELFDQRPGWGSATRNLASLALAPLSDAAMRQLLAGVVPGMPAGAIDTIVARAEGVPLYAVELVRMLVADGRLVAADGRYEPKGDLGTLTIPETLRSLIASRLDGLEPTDRALVQDAAVLGQVFTVGALAAVTGRDEAKVAGRLRALVRRELVELESDPRSPERGQYRFVQSLIREVAYAGLAKAHRRARHLAVARFFEGLGEEELAGALANHYLSAYQASASGAEASAVAIQARLALQGAARRAAVLGAHAQAVSYLRQALEVTTEGADRAAILLDGARSANVSADYAIAEEMAREAIAIHEGLGDRSALGRAHAVLGQVLIDAGRVPEAATLLDSALRDVPDDDEAVRAALLTMLSRASFRLFEDQRAIELADQALPIIERLNLEDLAAEALTNKGSALSNLGRRREAEALLEAGIRIARAEAMSGTVLRASNNLAGTVGDVDLRRATRILREGYQYAQRIGERGMGEWLLWSAVSNEYDLGDDWNGPLAEIEEVLARGTTAANEHRFLFAALMFRASRGDPEAPAYLERIVDAGKRTTEAGATDAEDAIRGIHTLMAGDLIQAYEILLGTAGRYAQFIPVAMPWAIRAAVWARDVDRIATAVERFAAAPFSGPISLAIIAAGRAAIDGLEGRTADAVERFRESIRSFADMELHTYRALTTVDMVMLLGARDAETRAAADDARAILERLGARPFRERLDDAMAKGGHRARATTPARAADAEAAVDR